MSAGGPRVGFVMLAWNLPELEARCVASIQTQDDPNWQLVIVDNASSPPFQPARELVGDSRVTHIRNEDNLGYAKGMNIGLAQVRAEFLVPVNGDVALGSDFVAQLKSRWDWCKTGRIGAVAPLVFRGSPDNCQGLESKGWFLRGRFSLITDPEMPNETEVFSGSGACTAYLADCLREVCQSNEVFDSSYFAYGEDIDLLFRIHYARWRCLYLEDLVTWHVGSAYGGEVQSALAKPEWLQVHILSNRVRNIAKYLSWRDLIWFGPRIAVTEIGMLASSLFLGKPPLGIYRESYRAVWRDRKQLLGRRREVLSRRGMSTRELIRLTRGI